MLKNAAFAIAAPFALCLAFFSCKTTGFFAPGEKKVVVDNIYVEYYNIAEEYFKIPNYQKAADYYLKAARNKEISNASYFKAARSYALAKDWNKSLDIYLEILKHDKDNESVKESVAYIYAMSGDFEKSERYYLELLSTCPDLSRVLVNYTIVLATLEKYEEAAKQLELLKEKFPDEKKIQELDEKISAALKPSTDESEGQIPSELVQPELE